jgi:hypothetical protein
MKQLHMPTMLGAIVIGVIVLGLYHVTLGRKG